MMVIQKTNPKQLFFGHEHFFHENFCYLTSQTSGCSMHWSCLFFHPQYYCDCAC